MDLTYCPQCGSVAEVLWRTELESTDGLVEHGKVLCLNRHGFFLPVESLPSVAPVERPTPQPAMQVRRQARATHRGKRDDDRHERE